MRAGGLTEKITIRQRKVVRGLSGGESYIWEDLMTVRASVKFYSGKREEGNREYFHNQVNRVVTYYRPSIKREMRIVYQNEVYQINSIDRDRLKNTMTLIIELVNE